jgi:hypothetical protein
MRHPSVLPVVSVIWLFPTVKDAHVPVQCAMVTYWASGPVQLDWISAQ